MELEIHMTYHRYDPGGRVTAVEIRSEAELKYHRNLVESGYRYEAFEKVKQSITVDTKPRIHPGHSICESCEG